MEILANVISFVFGLALFLGFLAFMFLFFIKALTPNQKKDSEKDKQ